MVPSGRFFDSVSTTKAYAVCMHGIKGVFEISLSKRLLIKLVKMALSDV